jgi:glyoxylase-like metal-dependent hydrolase (beta-lactamase superfamily II)
LIDCGYEGTEYKIEEALSKNGHTGRDIDYLIVTHAHGDHAGAARNLQKMYGCKVIAGERDRFHFENGKNAEICPVSFTAKMMSWFLSSSFPGISPDSTIANGDTLSLAEWPIEIFQMPGHTPGSLIIRCEQSLFVGDLIRGKIGNHQKAVRHYFMCDLEGNDEDIKSLLKAYPNTVWYPGHFGPLTSPENY